MRGLLSVAAMLAGLSGGRSAPVARRDEQEARRDERQKVRRAGQSAMLNRS